MTPARWSEWEDVYDGCTLTYIPDKVVIRGFRDGMYRTRLWCSDYWDYTTYPTLEAAKLAAELIYG